MNETLWQFVQMRRRRWKDSHTSGILGTAHTGIIYKD